MAANLLTPAAALLAGLATSLHCAAMCGPLVCAFRVRPTEYHLSRLVSYTLAGLLCGGLGQGVAAMLQGNTARIFPWAFACVLIVLGFGLEKRLPQPRFATMLFARLRLNRSLGLLTPLLPCGPLWLMFGAAALTGNAFSGAVLMFAFTIGTIPLPLILQTQAMRWMAGAARIRWIRPTLAFTSAGLLIWRASLPLHACCH